MNFYIVGGLYLNLFGVTKSMSFPLDQVILLSVTSFPYDELKTINIETFAILVRRNL